MSREDQLLSALHASAKAIRSVAVEATTEKTSAADFVTAADHRSEEAAREILGSKMISEEDPSSHEWIHDPSWSGWIIDPLDGTNNFARGIPYYCISLAWIEAGEPQLGGVLDPLHDELWVASLGGGAIRNGQNIEVSSATSFGPGTRVCSSNSYTKGETEENLARYRHMPGVWVDFLSSLALDLVYLAEGRIDFLHHRGLYPWDSAAGLLIAREAGAEARDLSGQEATWRSRELAVGNPSLLAEFFA